MARVIPLKNVEFEEEGFKDTLDYKDQILLALKTPIDQQGANYEEMEQVLPLRKKIRTCEDEEVVLEDSEHETLVRYMKAAKFRLSLDAIHEMLKEIIEAPQSDLKAVVGEKKGGGAK